MYYVFAVAFGIVLVCLLLWQFVQIAQGYQKAQGTSWQRFLAAFSDSQTILLARVAMLASAAIAFFINVLPIIDPSSAIGQQIMGYLKPQWVPLYTLAFAILVEYVRRRPGSIDPITPPAQSKP